VTDGDGDTVSHVIALSRVINASNESQTRSSTTPHCLTAEIEEPAFIDGRRGICGRVESVEEEETRRSILRQR